MKKNNAKWIVFLIMSVFIVSCSQDIDDKDNPVTADGEILAPVNISTRSLPANTSCDMYIFWKNAGATDYDFKEKMEITVSPTSIKFRNQDLANKSYRFLFMTSGSNISEMNLIDKNTGTWNDGPKWSDLIVRANTYDLTDNNFYGIVDKTGSEIMDGGTIQATLTRMIGQWVLDIFKVQSSIDNPINIISNGSVASVIDRVYKIDVTYTGLTRDVTFNSSNAVVEYEAWGSNHTQTFTTNFDPVNFQVPINGSVAQLERTAGSTEGSVRIKGLRLLPVDQKLRCKLTFYYYDTTPKCLDLTHQHDQSCFEEKTLPLNLPELTNNNLFSIIPDHYTVNKAGIRFDRIIDLEQGFTFGFNTIWGNEIINE